MKTWLLRFVAAAAVAATALSAAVSAAAAATYQITPFDSTVWEVDGSVARPLSFPQWDALGRPAPSVAPLDYITYPWSVGIWARTAWTSPAPQSSILTFDQWSSVGHPAARNVSWIDGTYVYRWSTGSPVGVIDGSGTYHWLSQAEWAAMGWPAPDVRADEGFAKLTWSPEIARMTSVSRGQGFPIDGAAWRSDNYAAPLEVPRFAGDQFYRNAGSSMIFYAGPTMNRAITLAEWQAAGSPSPDVRGIESGIPSSTWEALARCESGGNPRAVSASGRYHGLYQFSTSTWSSIGGSGLPSQATPDEQTERAILLQARSGWGQWPHCARTLGLI